MYFNRIHYLRGIMALIVVFSHVGHFIPGSPPHLIAAGSTMVRVFTVIAGFFAWRSILKLQSQKNSPWLVYARARFLRLYPVHWLFLIFIFLWMWTGFDSDKSWTFQDHTWKDWLSYIALVHFGGTPTLGNWWLYYLILFQLFLVPIIRNYKTWPIVLLLYIASAIICGRLWPDVPIYGLTSFSFLFVIGAGLAMYEKQLTAAAKTWPLFVAAGIITLLIPITFDYIEPIARGGSVLLFVGILFWDKSVPVTHSGYTSKLLDFLGNISYSLYIGHFLVFRVITYYLKNIPPPILHYIMIFSAIVVTSLAYKYVEKRAAQLGSQNNLQI